MKFNVQLVRKPTTVSTTGGDSHAWSYRWLVTLDNGHGPIEIDYWTGCANYTAPDNAWEKHRIRPEAAMQIAAGLNTYGLSGHLVNRFKPTEPDLAGVCYSLRSDLEAADLTFRDFCDEYGYDGNPADALDTYNACVSSRDRLTKAGITLTTLEPLIPEDY